MNKKIILAGIFLLLVHAFFGYYSHLIMTDNTKTHLEEASKILSTNDEIIRRVSVKSDADKKIQGIVSKYVENKGDIDVIIVADADMKMYSHVEKDKIGEKYYNWDGAKVLKKGEGSFSKTEGYNGVSLRRIEPIETRDGIVGFVLSAKVLKHSFERTKQLVWKLALSFILSLLGAFFFFRTKTEKKKG